MKYTKNIFCFIKEVADVNYARFDKMGHAAPGNNGPYRFVDTAVRNTAHWLIIYAYLWKNTNEDRYKNIVIKFAEYLLIEQQKSDSGAIECMDGSRFDHLNGLIGQAWVIEALIYAYESFSNDDYLKCAVAIFNSQKFDEETALWHRIELDGNDIGFDPTLNHQVWFAAAGLMILRYQEDEDIRHQVETFLNRIETEYFGIYSNGLIKHYGTMKRPRKLSKSYYIKQFIKDRCVPMRKVNPNKFDSKAQEKGYHLFELYGFAVIKQYYSNYKLFEKDEFKKALDYGMNIDFINKILNISPVLNKKVDPLTGMNRFAYGYNSPAFEYPLIEYLFTGKSREAVVDKLLDIQKELTYDSEKGLLSKNNYDGETLTARLYEYVRYCNLIDFEFKGTEEY